MTNKMTDEIDLSCYAKHLTDAQLGELVRMLFDHLSKTGIKVHVGEFGLSDVLSMPTELQHPRLDATAIIGRVLKYALEKTTKGLQQQQK
jgi:hypothetical protein